MRNVYEVESVIVYGRTGRRLRGVEVRVGLEDVSKTEPRTQIQWNEVCDASEEKSAWASLRMAVFDCSPPFEGRYVSLQKMTRSTFEIAEVEIFGEPGMLKGSN